LQSISTESGTINHWRGEDTKEAARMPHCLSLATITSIGLYINENYWWCTCIYRVVQKTVPLF